MKLFAAALLLMASIFVYADERAYQLTIENTHVNFSGKPAKAMSINGSIPGPVLEFTEGETAVIDVLNNTDADATIHWHGLLLPQDQDGVPYLTMLPIKAGERFQYRFPLSHAGTYWYHSHSRIDEQKGQYGAIVVHPKTGYQENLQYDLVVQLSDWTDEDPHQVLKNLKKDGDWYAYKKNSVVSISGYLKHSDISAWLSNRWQRMEGMDVSDVGYDAFLANGKKRLELAPDAKAGDKVRLRIINSGASTMFDVQHQQAIFKVIAADGTDVQPIRVQSFRMGMAETYDVVVEIPASGALEFAANNVDGTGGVKIQLGSGTFEPSPNPKKADIFAKMEHSQHKHQHDMGSTPSPTMENAHLHHRGHHMNHSAQAVKLDYSMLKLREPVNYQGELQEFTLKLTGDMESYNWSFNNTPLSKADLIKIDRGKVVRFHFINTSMMSHPLHLHGHFFKVISGNGDYDVLKHTVNVAPMASVTIEFAANEEKDWFFHCHNLYHAKTGMARVVRYSDYDGNPEFNKAKKKSREIMDDDWYPRSDILLSSQFTELGFRLSNARHTLLFSGEEHYDENETEAFAHYQYRQSRWLQYYMGVEHEEHENEVVAGLKYTTPFLIETATWISDDGDLHIEAETEFPLTPKLNLELMASTDSEWELSLAYRRSPNWAMSLSANDISGLGLGFSATF